MCSLSYIELILIYFTVKLYVKLMTNLLMNILSCWLITLGFCERLWHFLLKLFVVLCYVRWKRSDLFVIINFLLRFWMMHSSVWKKNCGTVIRLRNCCQVVFCFFICVALWIRYMHLLHHFGQMSWSLPARSYWSSHHHMTALP